MKALRIYSPLLIAALWICPQIAMRAQSGPSLDDTIQFLTEKLRGAGTTILWNVDTQYNHIHTSASYEVIGCNNGALSIKEYFKVDQDVDTQPSNHSSNIILNDIPLGKMSTEVKVNRCGAGYYYISIRASDGSAVISSQTTVTDNSTGQSSQSAKTLPELDIFISNGDDANRIANALKHAIELSGGKKELFDATPPQ